MNNIVSKRTLAGWVSLWLGLILVGALMAVVFMPRPAHATADKLVTPKRDYWSMNRSYAAPNNVGSGTHIETEQISIAANYLFWPDGSSVNKIALVSYSVCYNRLQGNGALFQGANGNPFFFDDNDSVNPGDLAVNSDGTDYNCTARTIPLDSRQWFRMDQSPGWQAVGKVRIAFWPDDVFDFKWGGARTKYFAPGDDPNTGDPFYCECNYGGASH